MQRLRDRSGRGISRRVPRRSGRHRNEHQGALRPGENLLCNSRLYVARQRFGHQHTTERKILHNNIVSNHWLANMVLPEMAQRKDGAVIIVSSIGGLKGSGVLGAYAISKAADMQLARNLAIEWGPDNVRINCIAPGLIRTDFARALWENPEVLGHYEKQTPLRRIGEPEDIGGIAVLLASRAGAFITGQTIVADGGVTIAG